MSDAPEPSLQPTASYTGMITEYTLWGRFEPRAGDIIVSTPPKSGTTWMQAIIALLLSGDPDVDVNPSHNAPWFDNALHNMDDLLARLNAQPGRRQIKTHTPLNGVPIWDDLHYITVYRHPIDVHFSSRKHVQNYRPEVAEFFGISEQTHPSDPKESFRLFLERDDMDHGSLNTIVTHYLATLDCAPRARLLRLHYADMSRDLAGVMQRVANYIGSAQTQTALPKLTRAATFANMKANADRFAVAAGKAFWRDDAGFFDSATSGKWKGVLGHDDLAAYNRKMSDLMDVEERSWLEWGRHQAERA